MESILKIIVSDWEKERSKIYGFFECLTIQQVFFFRFENSLKGDAKFAIFLLQVFVGINQNTLISNLGYSNLRISS